MIRIIANKRKSAIRAYLYKNDCDFSINKYTGNNIEGELLPYIDELIKQKS